MASPIVPLAFADVAVPNKAFKRVVRDLEFDVAELALMTFLMARSRGVPLRLLPVVVFSRNPLPHLVYDASAAGSHRGLAPRRIGVRSYTTTTAVWVRALLAISSASISTPWMDDARRRARGRRVDPPARLPRRRRRGSADDAAGRRHRRGIVDPVPAGPRFVPVVPDPEATFSPGSGSTALAPSTT